MLYSVVKTCLLLGLAGVVSAAPTGHVEVRHAQKLLAAELSGTVQDPNGNHVPKEQWLREQLRNMLGREPNAEELEGSRKNAGAAAASSEQSTDSSGKKVAAVAPGSAELTGSVQNPDGTAVPKEQWLKEQLRGMLGREPNLEELRAARTNEMAKGGS